MAINLVDLVKEGFTDQIVGSVSSQLGESSSGVSKAISGMIPSLLGGVMSKANEGTAGVNSILDMAKNAMGSLGGGFDILGDGNLKAGGNILSGLFGDNKLSGIINAISGFAGIKKDSASSLLSMGAPLIMGKLGKYFGDNNLGGSGLISLFASQKDNILGAMPSGLSGVTGLLGLGSLASGATKVASNLTSGAKEVAGNVEKTVGQAADEVKKAGNKWLLPLIILLLLALLLWYLFGRGDKKVADIIDTDKIETVTQDVVDGVKDGADKVKEGAGKAVDFAKELVSIKVSLPDGVKLDAYKGGIEDQLVTFLKSDWKSLSEDELKAKWFNFDNLNFETGTSNLTEDSKKQLDNIGAILKAFPDANLKLGGYTDITGNADFNLKLSQDRADAAKTALEARGFGSQITGAEGYGSKFAKYPAEASDEERATDRHISVSVRK